MTQITNPAVKGIFRKVAREIHPELQKFYGEHFYHVVFDNLKEQLVLVDKQKAFTFETLNIQKMGEKMRNFKISYMIVISTKENYIIELANEKKQVEMKIQLSPGEIYQ